MKGKVILAYSGGLDTSVAIKWLTNKGYGVVAYMADIGQDADFDNYKKRALKSGAVKAVVEDLKSEFVEDFVFKSLKAGAVYEEGYLLATALSRPLIAKHLVKTAEKEMAGLVAHGCTGKGNDQVRFEVSVGALNSKLKILYVGRLSPEKNIGMLIQATKKIKHDLELQIVGSGTEEARLKGLAAGDDRIVFLGEKKYEDLPSIFQAADIFVLPSRTETFGQVLLQAAAAGCAIVATRTTGASAFITHLQNGWLTEVDNERELGAAIETLITDRRQRDDLAASAGKLAGEYDMNAATEKLIKFWKEVARK